MTQQARNGRNWVKEITRASGGRLNPASIRVTFPLTPTGERWLCKLRWGKKLERSVLSCPSVSQDVAFDEAMRVFRRAFEKELDGKLNLNVQVDKPEQIASVIDEDHLLHVAKERWKIERNWLMKKARQSHSEAKRFNQLNSFLVLFDPLRKYEVEYTLKHFAIASLRDELAQLATDLAPENSDANTVTRLRLLMGKRVAEAGTPISISSEFRDHLYGKGIDPQAQIDSFISDGVIRFSRESGALSLSTVGANFLERVILDQGSIQSVAASIPHSIFSMLCKLADENRR